MHNPCLYIILRTSHAHFKHFKEEMSETKNGRAIILKDRAQALANYPHARVVGNLIFVSGISSRKLDGSWEGSWILFHT